MNPTRSSNSPTLLDKRRPAHLGFHPVAFLESCCQSSSPLSFLGLPAMKGSLRKILSISLVLCILTVGGLAQAQSAEHAGHHAQHQTATHGTLLCSWMCAAGTVLDSPVVLIQAERNPIAVIPVIHSSNSISEPSPISSGRAPPFSL